VVKTSVVAQTCRALKLSAMVVHDSLIASVVLLSFARITQSWSSLALLLRWLPMKLSIRSIDWKPSFTACSSRTHLSSDRPRGCAPYVRRPLKSDTRGSSRTARQAQSSCDLVAVGLPCLFALLISLSTKAGCMPLTRLPQNKQGAILTVNFWYVCAGLGPFVDRCCGKIGAMHGPAHTMGLCGALRNNYSAKQESVHCARYSQEGLHILRGECPHR